MKKLQGYKNPSIQVRIDSGLHQLLKIKAAKSRMTIKTLLEGYIADILKEETSQNSP